MSLSAPVKPDQFAIAILASTSLEDPILIPSLLGENLAAVSHIYTNGANPLVARFAAEHGIAFTIHPLTGGSSLPASTNAILDTENLAFAYVIVDEGSKSGKLVVDACEKKGIEHKVIRFDPVDYWRGQVCKVREILDAATKDDIAASLHLQSIAKAVA